MKKILTLTIIALALTTACAPTTEPEPVTKTTTHQPAKPTQQATPTPSQTGDLWTEGLFSNPDKHEDYQPTKFNNAKQKTGFCNQLEIIMNVPANPEMAVPVKPENVPADPNHKSELAQEIEKLLNHTTDPYMTQIVQESIEYNKLLGTLTEEKMKNMTETEKTEATQIMKKGLGATIKIKNAQRYECETR